MGVTFVFICVFYSIGVNELSVSIFALVLICITLTTIFLHYTESLKPIEWKYVPKNRPFTLVRCVAAKIRKEEKYKPKHLQKGEYLYHVRFGILHYTIIYSLPIPYIDGTKIMKLSDGKIVSCNSQKNHTFSSEDFCVKDESLVI